MTAGQRIAYTGVGRAADTPANRRSAVELSQTERSVLRAAVRLAPVSAGVAALGIVFITIMFGAFATNARPTALAFGWLNDLMVLVSYLLAVPLVLALHVVFRHRGVATGPGGFALATVAVVALAAVVVLQGLLVAGRIAFEDEVVPASVAILAFGAWLVIAGWLASRAGIVTRGARMGLVGASYLGYPLWAVWAGRTLRSIADLDAPAPGRVAMHGSR